MTPEWIVEYYSIWNKNTKLFESRKFFSRDDAREYIALLKEQPERFSVTKAAYKLK